MAKNNDIKIMLILLVILSLGIGYLLSEEGHIESLDGTKENKVSYTSAPAYVEVSGGQEVVKSNRVLISDKFVGEFDADGQVVVLDSSGSAFVVHDGVVLVSNEVVIDARSDELSVVRLNERIKSISSN